MDINAAIKELDRIEANLHRMLKIRKEMVDLIPDGVSFSTENESRYDELTRLFNDIWLSMPKINAWKPEITIYSLNDIARNRMDAQELGEIEIEISNDEKLAEPNKILEEYHYYMKKSRREFIKKHIVPLIEAIDLELQKYSGEKPTINSINQDIPETEIKIIIEAFKSIDVLLGSLKRPTRWSDMSRHLSFHTSIDMSDIKRLDWPNIKEEFDKTIYSDYEPLPVNISDISDLVGTIEKGKIITKLKWESINEEIFERLIFNIISNDEGYENTKWLSSTNAPDRGRDLSTTRAIKDNLTGSINQRVIIQCKHWLKRSIKISDVADLQAQMRLWEPPKVDVCILVSSGRFTTDAIDYIEKFNQGNNGMNIEMWPESHLEAILAKHPDIVAEYKLR